MAEDLSDTIQLMFKLIHDEEGTSVSNRSLAWCVLSNAIGSTAAPNWRAAPFPFVATESGGQSIGDYTFNQILDRALNDCDSSEEGPSNASLRQSAGAFLYNSLRYLISTDDAGTGYIDGGDDVRESTELSEGILTILLGCIEQLQNENDITTMQRLYMTVGQILKSHQHGKMAADLVNDLGLMDDDEIRRGKKRGGKEVEGLADEVAFLLRANVA